MEQKLESYKNLVSTHIEVIAERHHAKASERYVDVVFQYPDTGDSWEGSVPIEYRRTGLFAEAPEEVATVIQSAYDAMHPSRRVRWLRAQERFWAQHKRVITQAFFDALKTFKWTCVSCTLPKNPNWARRVQDIKELGYTIATDTRRFCNSCGKNTTQLILIALPRGAATGYETWDELTKNRILAVLGYFDAYENRFARSYSLLPDHKFPEIRWDVTTRGENPRDMSDEEIRAKFQLLTNQRNQQKREVCRMCFQTGWRGTPFGIFFFVQGNEYWPSNVPPVGKEAEQGCVGCGWYDLAMWREELNKYLKRTT